MVVNLVQLGRLRVLKAQQHYTRQVFLTAKGHGSSDDLQIRAVPASGLSDATLHQAAVDDLHQREYDTLASPNLDIIVSPNAEWVMPIFEVVILPSTLNRPQCFPSRYASSGDDGGDPVCFRQIGSGLIYAMDLGGDGGETHKIADINTTDHLFLVSAAHAKSDWPLVLALANFIGSIASDTAHLHLAGSVTTATAGTWRAVKVAEQVHSAVKGAELADKSKAVDAQQCTDHIAAAVQFAVDRIGKTPLDAVGTLTTIIYLVVPPG